MVQIGKPQNVVGRSLTQADYQTYLLDNLKRYKYRARAPIHDMMTYPNNLYQTMHDTADSLLLKIMANIFHYGRAHWTWEATTAAESTKAFDEGAQSAIEQLPGGTTGRGLLDGTISGCACGGFAAAMKGMTAQVFNIETEKSNVDGSTSIFADFITGAGVQVIDSHWHGNVWLDTNASVNFNKLSNKTVAAFEFRNHYFCNYKGTIYDVTCNKAFANTNAIMWCKLTKDDSLRPNYPGTQTVYKTAEVTKGVLTLAKYLVWINKEPSIGNGFSNWLLTDRNSIPAADMQAMQTWSSR